MNENQQKPTQEDNNLLETGLGAAGGGVAGAAIGKTLGGIQGCDARSDRRCGSWWYSR